MGDVGIELSEQKKSTGLKIEVLFNKMIAQKKTANWGRLAAIKQVFSVFLVLPFQGNTKI